MTKAICLLLAAALFACNGKTTETESGHGTPDSSYITDDYDSADTGSSVKVYANERFKDVTVQKIGADTFTIEGKGQIFEANFGWVVEDGHQELKSGHEMTDAGAPEWGKFKFRVEVEKQRPISTLTLVLYETSAKDGSRQHELPMPLP